MSTQTLALSRKCQWDRERLAFRLVHVAYLRAVAHRALGLVTEPHTMLDLVLACAVRARCSPGPPSPACAARPLQPSGWRVANSVQRSSTLAACPGGPRIASSPMVDPSADTARRHQ